MLVPERKQHAFFNAEVELQGSACFVTCHERYVLELAEIICDLFESEFVSRI